MNTIKIEITEEEWYEASPQVRNRIIELMSEQGYDAVSLQALEEAAKPLSDADVFKQFYGEEEAD